jgi:hypothetical protein
MRRFIVRHKVISALVGIPLILLCAIVLFEYGGGPMGHLQAKWDLSRKDYRIKAIGLEDVWWEEYSLLLNERYRIKADRVAYCTPTPWELAYSEAYNGVTWPAIEEHFQQNVFRECYEDSVRSYLSSHAISDDERKVWELALKQ